MGPLLSWRINFGSKKQQPRQQSRHYVCIVANRSCSSSGTAAQRRQSKLLTLCRSCGRWACLVDGSPSSAWEGHGNVTVCREQVQKSHTQSTTAQHTSLEAGYDAMCLFAEGRVQRTSDGTGAEHAASGRTQHQLHIAVARLDRSLVFQASAARVWRGTHAQSVFV